MADVRKPQRPRRQRLQVERDVHKVGPRSRQPTASAPAPVVELSTGELYRRSVAQQQEQLDRLFPWRQSYANWCTHVGRAAARHGSAITFGEETYAAWESGISPDAYAEARGGDSDSGRS